VCAGVTPQLRCARIAHLVRPPHRPDCFLIAIDSTLKRKGDTMKRKLVTSSLLMSALVLPVMGHTAGDSDSDRSSMKSYAKDTEITTKVKAQMAMDKHVSALHIKVDTDNRGVVTLTGKAKSREEADKAVSIARSVEGVVAVEDNIQIVSNR
jgi:hyperosmotically inducible protein